jgi:hypothetical protein
MHMILTCFGRVAGGDPATDFSSLRAEQFAFKYRDLEVHHGAKTELTAVTNCKMLRHERQCFRLCSIF